MPPRTKNPKDGPITGNFYHLYTNNLNELAVQAARLELLPSTCKWAVTINNQEVDLSIYGLLFPIVVEGLGCNSRIIKSRGVFNNNNNNNNILYIYIIIIIIIINAISSLLPAQGIVGSYRKKKKKLRNIWT